MRAFDWLLHAYPASFRHEYGGEMRAVFARRRAAARGCAVAGLWLDAVRDTLANAPVIHADILRQDIRYTTRVLVRVPGFSVMAILVAALGIGATTTAFSIADHVLVRPLPFPQSDRLVKIRESQEHRGSYRMELSPANFRDWQREAQSFSGMGFYAGVSATLIGHGAPERLDGDRVSANLFDVLAVRPAMGRGFVADDDLPSSAPVVVLSNALWRSRFAADPDIIGRRLTLDSDVVEVVGVMPADFEFPGREITFWRTSRFGPDAYVDRTDTFLRVVGRLAPGRTLPQARADLSRVAADLARAYPAENAQTGATVIGLRDEIPQDSRLIILTIVGASVCVLLIACANLANLLLARGLMRRRELAVRAAIGAGRERIVRQLLTESLLLSIAGGVIGIGLAFVATPFVAGLVPSQLPIAAVPAVDLRMLALAACVTLATGIGFGMLPAWRAGRGADAISIREGARAGLSRRTTRLRAAIIVVEIAASVTLLVSTGLLVRALWRVQQIDPGFRAAGVLTLRTAPSMPKYEATETREVFYRRVLTDVRAIPGVTSAAYISFLPMVMRGGIWPVLLPGHSESAAEAPVASLRYVTPGFFKTVGVPIRMGRDVADTDRSTALDVAVVSDSFGRTFWPGENPLGRRFTIAFAERTIVGVAGDIHVRGLERTSEPQVYLPSPQVPDGSIINYVPKDLAIASSLAPSALVPAVRAIVARADPTLAISSVRPLGDIVDDETASRRAELGVIGGFAAVAVVLGGVGIHGLLAFAVSMRLREIGTRMAVGATPWTIARLILRESMTLTVAGVAVGMVVAYGAGRAFEALLAGVGPIDGPTFAIAAAASFLIAAAGSLGPTRRALRVDPLSVMRAD